MQKVNLYEQPIASLTYGKVPLYLKVVRSDPPQYMEGGPLASPQYGEVYVLLSALPDDLKRKVEDAIRIKSQQF